MQKKRLIEADVLRTLAIILVLLGHCIIMYINGTQFFDSNLIEKRIIILSSSILRSFTLPATVLAAGYTFAYLQERRQQDLTTLIKSKFKRLFIPTIFFGIIYILLFQEFTIKFKNIGIVILSGVGHLWYLPMLFWVFIEGFIIEKIINKRNQFLLLTTSIILSILVNDLPKTFGITFSFEYLPFFILGIILWKNHDLISTKWKQKSYILLFTSLYILSFILFQSKFINHIEWNNKKWLKEFTMYLNRLSGILFVFLLILRNLEFKKFTRLQSLTPISYGIYVFHLFILKILFEKFNIPNFIPYQIGPLVMFILVLIPSIYVSKYFKKTKLGKYLLG